jgi:hypothetical protein
MPVETNVYVAIIGQLVFTVGLIVWVLWKNRQDPAINTKRSSST